LIGDCIGKRFEGIWGPNMNEMLDDFKLLKERMNELDASESSCDESYNIFINDNLKKYTDDTALTRAVCDSLLDKGELDVVDMALTLQQTYFREPNRGYTSGAINIFKKFHKLKSTNQLAECCFLPAMELFNGEGSFGNGGGIIPFKNRPVS
jgi:ADP-ribosylglycohydrolase